MAEEKSLPNAVLSCMHPPSDGRVGFKLLDSMSKVGAVEWLGPECPSGLSLPSTASMRLFPRRHGLWGRIAHEVALWRSARRHGPYAACVAVEPDSALIALALRARGSVSRVAFDVEEDYAVAHSINKVPRIFGLRRLAAACVSRLLRVIGTKSDVVFAVNGEVGGIVGRTPMGIIRNAPPAAFSDEISGLRQGSVQGRNRVFHGRAGTTGRGTKEALTAVGMLDDLDVTLIVFRGGQTTSRNRGPSWEDEGERLGVMHKVEFLDPRPFPLMPEVYASCDVGLVAYQGGLAEKSLPNRVFEYMAAGIPAIVPIASRGMRSLVEEEGCGLAVDATSPQALAGALRLLLEDQELRRKMGERGRQGFLARYSWESEVRPLQSWLSNSHGLGSGGHELG